MTLLDEPKLNTIPHHKTRIADGYITRNGLFIDIRSHFFRSINRVPSSLQASLITGLSGLFLSFMSLWPRINDLNEWGTFGMRMGALLILALPLSIVALALSTSWRLSTWRELGMVRMVLTTLIGVTSLVLSLISAYVMYNALP